MNPLIDSHSFDYLLLKKDDWTVSIIEELKKLFHYQDPKTVELEIFEASVRICKTIYQHVQVNPPKTEASSFNVGKTLCAKLFKKYVSKTPGEYLIHYRIQKSIELLTDTNMSMNTV